MDSVFDPGFDGVSRSGLYRAQVAPEEYPDESPMRVENWPAEDREAWCGGVYARG